MKKTIKINGIDFSDLFTMYGYTVQYKKISGPNSGYMLSGDYTDDVRKWKAVITCIAIPTTEEQLSALLSEVCDGAYCTVYFFDPKIKAYRTAEMMPSEPSQKHRGTGSNAFEYWTGTVLTFTER